MNYSRVGFDGAVTGGIFRRMKKDTPNTVEDTFEQNNTREKFVSGDLFFRIILERIHLGFTSYYSR